MKINKYIQYPQINNFQKSKQVFKKNVSLKSTQSERKLFRNNKLQLRISQNKNKKHIN